MAVKRTARATPKKATAAKRGKAAGKNYRDMSGTFDPDLKFEDLSKEFLLELINVYQFAWCSWPPSSWTASRSAMERRWRRTSTSTLGGA